MNSYFVEHELNIHTYAKWFPVLDALELDKNTLCTLAINQMVTFYNPISSPCLIFR